MSLNNGNSTRAGTSPKHEPRSEDERELEHGFHNRHNNLLSRCTARRRCVWQGLRGLPLDMTRIHPERPDSDPSDQSIAAHMLLRREPDDEEEDEEEEEDEGEGKEDNDGEDDDGYSE